MTTTQQHWKDVGEIILCLVAAIVFFTALNYAKHNPPVRDSEVSVSGYDGRPQLRQEAIKP